MFLKDLQGRAQRYSIDELEVLIGSGGLRELFHRFANESNRPWSLNDRTTFQQLFDGVPSKTGGKYRRKGISSFTASSGDIGNFARISTEAGTLKILVNASEGVNAFISAEAVKVLNLESEIHAADERIVKSCNPGRNLYLSALISDSKIRMYPSLVLDRELLGTIGRGA